jgi:hypothetical protein
MKTEVNRGACPGEKKKKKKKKKKKHNVKARHITPEHKNYKQTS